MRQLLDAAPAAARARDALHGRTPLAWATVRAYGRLMSQLLAAAPEAAALLDASGRTPFELALAREGLARGSYAGRHLAPARLLLAGPCQRPTAVLRALSRHVAHALYGDVPARWALSEEEWRLVPGPCPGLAPALPAVVARSEAEARLLVARLPQTTRRRLQTAALCLAREQRCSGVELPLPLARRVLALAAADDDA